MNKFLTFVLALAAMGTAFYLIMEQMLAPKASGAAAAKTGNTPGAPGVNVSVQGGSTPGMTQTGSGTNRGIVSDLTGIFASLSPIVQQAISNNNRGAVDTPINAALGGSQVGSFQEASIASQYGWTGEDIDSLFDNSSMASDWSPADTPSDYTPDYYYV